MPEKIKTLGVLMLANKDVSPPPPEGTEFYPDWFSYPLKEKVVPGALAREVIAGDLALVDSFVKTAQQLEQEGVSALTVLCGFSVIYQKAIADAVSIPVVTSSLLQLPYIGSLVPDGGRIGLLVFDKQQLTDYHFECAGFDKTRTPIAIVGIDGSKSWQNWINDTTTTDFEDLENTILNGVRQLMADYPDITHLLLECTGFPHCSAKAAAMTGLPVYDWATLCNKTMAEI